MPFVNGQYSAPASSWNPAVPGTTIESAAYNSQLSDIETALSTCVLKDGTQTITANIPMSGFKFTGVNTNSGNTSRSEYVSGATYQDGAPIHAGTTGGTSTAYTATLSPAITAYALGQRFTVKTNAACGANPTINFNTVGAKKIYKNVTGTATQLSANDVPNNFEMDLLYDTALDTAAGGFWLMNQPTDLRELTSARTSNTILADADARKEIIASTTFTQTLTAAATLGDGWWVDYRNNGTGFITLDPNSTETVDGQATIVLFPGESCRIICDGSNFTTVGRTAPGSWVTIETVTASASSALNFQSLNSAVFDEYELSFDLTMTTDDTLPILQIGTGVTPTYQTSGYSFGELGRTAAGSTVANDSASASGIVMGLDSASGRVGNASGEHVSARIMFFNPAATQYPTFQFSVWYTTAGGQPFSMTGSGWYGSSTAFTAVRLIVSGSNTYAAGTARLRGRVKF